MGTINPLAAPALARATIGDLPGRRGTALSEQRAGRLGPCQSVDRLPSEREV